MENYEIRCYFNLVIIINHLNQNLEGFSCTILSKLDHKKTITSYKIQKDDKNMEILTGLNKTTLNSIASDSTRIIKVHTKIYEGNIIKFPPGIEIIFSNLIFVNLDNIGLKELHQDDLKAFPKLNHLSFRNNEIKVLEKDLFKFNQLLVSVDFDGNELKLIDGNVFDDLKYLKTLHLVNNACISLDATNRQLTKIIELIKEECRVKERRVKPVEETVSKKKEFDLKKYILYFVVAVAGVIFVAIFTVVKRIRRKRVAPENLEID